jgi:hypothetical protein
VTNQKSIINQGPIAEGINENPKRLVVNAGLVSVD